VEKELPTSSNHKNPLQFNIPPKGLATIFLRLILREQSDLPILFNFVKIIASSHTFGGFLNPRVPQRDAVGIFLALTLFVLRILSLRDFLSVAFANPGLLLFDSFGAVFSP